MYSFRIAPWCVTSAAKVTKGLRICWSGQKGCEILKILIILAYTKLKKMTIHRARMQRQVRDKKQANKFFLALGILTLLLMLILYLVYG